MKSTIIFLLALILFILFSPLGLIYALIRGLSDGSFYDYMLKSAIGINQAGNVAMCYIFNDFFITGKNKRFGNPNETISHVLGVNKLSCDLLPLGKALAFLLNTIQPNHVEMAAKNPQ